MMQTFINRFFGFIIFIGVFKGNVLAYESVVLETVEGQSMQRIEGKEVFMDQMYSPASMFKIVITWAGLEEGKVTLQTEKMCSDSHLPGAPRKVDLHKALYYSSNDYFIQLAEEIGKERLQYYVEKSQFFNSKIPENWLKGEPIVVCRGGNMKISIYQAHQFILKVMRRQLTEKSVVQDHLWKALEWPSKHSEIQFYGKTGSFGGVFWFNGFGQAKGKWKAVTVFLKGEGASRDLAIQKFYKQWE